MNRGFKEAGYRLLLKEDVPFRSFREKSPRTMEAYRADGGYESLIKVIRQKKPAEVLEEIQKSGLRGRGGAGYPAWRKWEMVSAKEESPKYLCVNGAEEEPGTFKDRVLLRTNPHQLLEGALIAALTVGASVIYLYINRKFSEELKGMAAALAAARGERFWGEDILGSRRNIDVIIFPSPVAYVAGEETAMLEVIEGRRPAPRQKPPFYPVHNGLYGKPTLVNNVETLSHVPHILRMGGEAYRKIGVADSSGTSLFSLTGNVNNPGVYELPMGTPLRQLIDDLGGGLSGSGKLKAVFPGGPSCGLIGGDDLDANLDYEALKKRGTAFGTGAVIAFDDETCLVNAGLHITEFFSEESCGQCPPCKMGGKHLADLHQKIESGHGEMEDLQSIEQICSVVKGRGYCSLITGASVTVESLVRNFREEYENHIQTGKCGMKSGQIMQNID
ncbi:MAG TPA: NADH-ubiquinone oxidoreductase-F iron-sulfur binding region domain-containing protein [Nitrospiria bacterium]|nr:NADH-ubiquinone oxidoreductase-F iron-sulfur binding region domain-containing protein [Nitrospiria bacterium]